MPGLAMSRSIGDMIAHTVGVSPDPEVTRFDLGSRDKFIVIASDGVFEYLSDQEIGCIVQPYCRKNSPERAGKALVLAAAQRWRENDTVIDDITCIVICLDVDETLP